MRASHGGDTCTNSGATTCTVTGLTDGHLYAAHVGAVYTVVQGEPSKKGQGDGGAGPNCSAVGPGVDLVYCMLSDADLNGADLDGTDLTGARLAGADLAGTVLASATMTGSNLADADLSGCSLAAPEARAAIPGPTPPARTGPLAMATEAPA